MTSRQDKLSRLKSYMDSLSQSEGIGDPGSVGGPLEGGSYPYLITMVDRSWVAIMTMPFETLEKALDFARKTKPGSETIPVIWNGIRWIGPTLTEELAPRLPSEL